MAEPRRDDFPNHFVGDLVHTERGWVVVPPTCCPTATPTTTAAGQSVPCGVPAMGGTWRGDAIAAQPFTRRNQAALPNPRPRPCVDVGDEQERTPDS